MRLTLRQLEIFKAIAQQGSTVSASVALALSQSATSAALHELESALNVRLFERIGKRLVLNDEGRSLLPRAIRLLESASQIEEGFRQEGNVSRLRVGCSTTIGNYLMPLLAQMLGQRAAAVQIDVFMGNSTDIAKQAAQLTIDIGLIEGPCHLADLTAKPWCEDELVIVSAIKNPLAHKAEVTLDDLRDALWLMREEGSGTADEVLRLLMPHLGELRNTRQIGSSEAIKRMVAVGTGISCLPKWVVGDMITEGRLAVLSHSIPEHRRQLYTVHHKDKFISLALRDFLKVLDDFASTAP